MSTTNTGTRLLAAPDIREDNNAKAIVDGEYRLRIKINSDRKCSKILQNILPVNSIKTAPRIARVTYDCAKGTTFMTIPERDINRSKSQGRARGRFPAIIPIKTRPVMLVTPEIDTKRAVSGREIPNSVALSGMYVNGTEKAKIYRKLKRRKMANFPDFTSFGLMMPSITVWVGCSENKTTKESATSCFILCKSNVTSTIPIL